MGGTRTIPRYYLYLFDDALPRRPDYDSFTTATPLEASVEASQEASIEASLLRPKG